MDKAWFQYVVAVNCPDSNAGHAERLPPATAPTVPLSNVELYFLVQASQGDRRDGRLVTDALMPNIAAFKYCKLLYLTNAKIGDEGLAHLTGLHHLQAAWLNGTNMTDASLARLSKLEQLSHLAISNTKVTRRGVEDFQCALPECHVVGMP